MKRHMLMLLALIMVLATAVTRLVAEETLRGPKDKVAVDSVACPFRIADLLFVYRPPLLSDPKEIVRNLAEVVPKKKAVDAAFPDHRTQWIVDGVLDDHEFRLDEATLVDRGGMGLFWHVKWNLFPTSGGFGGVPWSYLAIVTGKCDQIQPEISLWSSFPVHGDRIYVRSHMDFENLARDNKGKRVLFGDEIANLAKRRLADFSKEHDVKSTGVPAPNEAGAGEPLSWRLQTQRIFEIDNHRIWEIRFTDDNWGAEDALDLRELTLWVTLHGEVSKLSIGAEELFPSTTRLANSVCGASSK